MHFNVLTYLESSTAPDLSIVRIARRLATKRAIRRRINAEIMRAERDRDESSDRRYFELQARLRNA